MADWTNPVLTSQYTALLDILKDRDFDLATMFSPTFSTGTNIPEGAVRWNPTSKIWEIRNASAGWDPLVTKYNIDVDKLDGKHGSYYLDWNNFTNKPATFTPTSHTHDDRYYTETEADGRFGFTLDKNGNNLRLKAADGTVLAAIQPNYAIAAGDAATVAGFSVNQNLRSTDDVTFNTLITQGNTTVRGVIQVGQNGGGNSVVNFYDDTNDSWRAIQWHNSSSKWRVEDTAGVFHELFHQGRLPTWSEVSGKPSTFAPSAHGHVFNDINKLILRTASSAGLSSITGAEAELIYNDTDGRLFVMDGVTLGGHEVAYRSDIPAPQNLSNYARKDQAETFSNTLTVNGNLTTQAQAQMLKGRILDNSAAATGKIMLSIEGDSDALQFINYSTGDYEIKNSGRGNSIRILDSTGGIQLRTNDSTRLLVNDSGIEVYGDILLNGNTMWHSGNDGAGSGLDADKLDGVEAVNFLQRFDRQNVDFDTITNGIYGIGSTATNVPTELLQGVLVDFFPTNGSVGFQIAANHTGDFYYRGGNGPNYGGGGNYTAWRKIWHDGNDGAGSGLDADKLDGIHASSFLRNDQNNTIASKTLTITGTSTIGGTTWNNGWLRIGTSTLGWSFDSNEIYGANGGTIGTLAGDLLLRPAGNAYLNSYRILTTADDGNLDAATLGGLDSSKFLRSDASDTGTTLTLDAVHILNGKGFSWENGTNWITHNDGGGNVQIRFGHQYDTDEVFTHAGTALYIGGDMDNAAGTLKLKVASNGGAGSGQPVTWGPVFAVSSTDVTWGGDVLWHAGNHGAGSGLDADTLDGVQAANFLRSDQNDTFTGNLTLVGTLLTDVITTRTGAPLALNAGDAAAYATGQTGEQIFLNAEGGVFVNTSPDNWASGWAGRKTTQIFGGSIIIDGNTAFHDGYHPNADKWTTSRTITLGGDLNGSVSLDGSSNVTLTATVVDDSHTHDGRYFTETEADARFVRRDADTEFNVGRGAVYIENNANDNDNGAGITIRTSNNPSGGSPDATGSIFAVRSSGQALRLWVGQSVTSTGDNRFETKDVQATSASGSWIATQAEAEAGTATNKIMTPERTAQAIAELSEGGLPRLNPGAQIRNRVDGPVGTYSTSFATRHAFNFMQKGTIRVSYDFMQSHNSTGQARVRRWRNNAWTTIDTYTGTTAWVTRTVDVAVMPGDQVIVEYKGAGYTGEKGNTTYYYGYIRNVRFQTNGEDLYPGIQRALEGNSA